MLDRALRFRTRPLRVKILCLEAYIALLASHFFVFFVPFRYLAKWASTLRPRKAKSGSPQLLEELSWAIDTGCRYSCWRQTCLTRAVAGKALLHRRGYASIIVLGMEPLGIDEVKAHAWLVCEKGIVLGRDGMSKCRPIASFGRFRTAGPEVK